MEGDQIEVVIQKQTGIALSKLNEFKTKQIHLKRPVIFVPGWCDEPCGWWIGPYQGIQGIFQWISQIADNPKEAIYVEFNNESPQCNSFLDFGQVLKNKIWAAIGKDQPFDLVGHSMGGLNIRAALTQGDPLLNCQNCITADTPHQGDSDGNFLELAKEFNPSSVASITPYQLEQAQNMCPTNFPIQTINRIDSRQLFLNRVNKFYQFKGTRDWVVMDSCFMDMSEIGDSYSQKVSSISVEGCEHIWIKGITLDVRTILAIVYMIQGIEIPSANNHGILPDGDYTPPNENEIFIG